MERTRFPGVFRLESGKYLVRWERRDPKTGKMRDRRKRVKAKSAEEASRKRAEEMDRDGKTLVERRTLGAFAISWLSGKMPNLSPTTRATYGQQLEHVTSFVFKDGRCFGDYYMDAIEHDDVIAYRDQSAPHYRAETVNGRLRVLKKVCKDAVVMLGMQRNPTLMVPPLPKDPKRRDRVIAAEQLRDMLAWLRDREANPQWYPLVLTLAVTGMRWSEATGLRWSDIDWTEHAITVRRRNLRGVERAGTKSGGDVYRVLPMLAELAGALRAHQRRIAGKPALARSGLVFPSETGEAYKGGSTALHKPLKRAAAAVGIERAVSAHDFRHSWNDVLRRVTDDEVQRSITGHSTPEMTAHYSHVTQSERMEAARRGLRMILGDTD